MDADVKLTRNQDVILGVLRHARKPLSAYQILEQTVASGIKAPPQIYRALEKLIEHRLVHRIESLNAYLVCDHAGHMHDVAFAICDSCGGVEEIPLQTMEPALKGSMAEHGFSVREAHVELRGDCGTCHATHRH